VSGRARRCGEPHDRLTRLCAEMTAVLDAKGDEVGDVRCIVFLADAERGGITTWGYEGEDDLEAIVDLIVHLQVLFEANGKKLMVVPIGEG
jgi:hypothetical protein